MFKKGDTLIEVALAVGIFSMIAISISAVMSSGVSNAQTALETTITREEIDTQAEALRFIHASYIADKESNDERFKNLWQEITKNAVVLDRLTDEASSRILQYSPSQCSELYSGSDPVVFNPAPNAKTFVINTRGLGNFTAKDINKVYIEASSEKFVQATTYPRLIYGSETQNDAQEGLISNQYFDNLYRAEGIYVVAVRDHKTTGLIDETGYQNKDKGAFYDFYIRTCWYGSNANEPTTISTVIRLYDPDAVPTIPPSTEEDPTDPDPTDPDPTTPDPIDPTPPTTIANIEYLQDVTKAIFYNTPNYMEASLVDKRTGRSYKVIKINNQLWLQEPLIIPPGTLFKDDSAIYTDKWEIIKTNSPRYNSTSPLTYNNTYNFCAVSGGAPGGCSSSSVINYEDKKISICPKGWSLPSVKDFDKANIIKASTPVNSIFWTSTSSPTYRGLWMATYDAYRRRIEYKLKTEFYLFTCIWEP